MSGMPVPIFESIIQKYLSAYTCPDQYHAAQKDINANLAGQSDKTVLSLYGAISSVRFAPCSWSLEPHYSCKDIIKEAILDILYYDSSGQLWNKCVNFYKLHRFIGDSAMIAYMERHVNTVSIDAYMNWMRAVYLNGIYSMEKHALVSPLCQKAFHILQRRNREAHIVADAHKIYFLETILYGGYLARYDYDKIFGSNTNMPSSMSYAGALLRICIWSRRYDVLEVSINEAKKRYLAKAKHIAPYYAPIFRSLSEMIFIRTKVITLQRAWRRYIKRKFCITVAKVCYKTRADPSIAYVVCANLYGTKVL